MKKAINYIYLIVPVFPEDDFMMNRMDAFNEWIGIEAPNLASRYSARIRPFLLGPGLRFPLKGGVVMQFSTPKGRSPRVPKGLAVRVSLMAVMDMIDNDQSIGVGKRNKCFIVQVDGSGAFKYDAVIDVLDKLILQRNSVVLGRRTGERWFMSHRERKDVEKFENKLLELWHVEKRGAVVHPELVDAQAGCWGLNAAALGVLSLTAPNYELEFDLVSSVLQSGCPFVFTSELMEGERIGGVSGHVGVAGEINYTPSVEKIPFIGQKLGFSLERILREIDAYIGEKGRTLPEEYLLQVRKKFRRRTRRPASIQSAITDLAQPPGG